LGAVRLRKEHAVGHCEAVCRPVGSRQNDLRGSLGCARLCEVAACAAGGT
jgi:hypothetical protein